MIYNLQYVFYLKFPKNTIEVYKALAYKALGDFELSNMHIYMCSEDMAIPAYHKKGRKRAKNTNFPTLEGEKKNPRTNIKHIAQNLYKI